MKLIYRSILLTGILLAAVFPTASANAHPLGNFSLNQYAGIKLEGNILSINYVLDMAEIPAYQEIAAIDHNGNQQPDQAETAVYALERCKALSREMALWLNNRPASLELKGAEVDFPAGQAGLYTLRLSCAYQAVVPDAGSELKVRYENLAFADRLGWREIIAEIPFQAISGGISTTSASQKLTVYPADQLSNPLDERLAEFSIDLQALQQMVKDRDVSGALQPAIASPPNTRNDGFTRLVEMEDLTPLGVLLALLAAFAWGAAHALTPGHGKTIVGAYLVGRRGTAQHAIYLGLATTIAHTAGVFALGLAMLLLSRFILTEDLFPWLSLASGLLVLGLGINLLLERTRGAGWLPKTLFAHAHPHDARASGIHFHPHNSHHEHDHSHSHSHDQEHSHDHDHSHDHEIIHEHDRLFNLHSQNHSEEPAIPEKVRWGSLLALGISGGIIPCPSALVVMLSAIALGRIGFGLALVTTFSIGLAGVLTAIGLMFVYARRWFETTPRSRMVLRWLPALSAAFIAMAGAMIAWRAVIEINLR